MYEYEKFIESDPYRYGVPDRNDDLEFMLGDEEEEKEEASLLSSYNEWRTTWKTTN